MYISARFVDNDFILSRLAEPGRWLKQMEDGGIFIHTPYNEYAYENAEAYRQAHEGKAAVKRHVFTPAIRHYQRAMSIFHSVSNDSEERQCWRDIASVDLERQIEKERKDLSPRQDVLG